LGINRQLERWRDPLTGESKINREERRYLVALLPNFEQSRISKSATLDTSTTLAASLLLRAAPGEQDRRNEEHGHSSSCSVHILASILFGVLYP
jgi:hypothetical protein